jgi:hypothetical protein
MINIIKILVLFSGIMAIFFFIFVVWVSKYKRQELINSLSFSLLYKTKDIKSIVTNNSTALIKIRQIKKEFFYSNIVVSIALSSLWLLPYEFLEGFPKSILFFVVFEVWIAFIAISILEYLLKTVNERLGNEMMGEGGK